MEASIKDFYNIIKYLDAISFQLAILALFLNSALLNLIRFDGKLLTIHELNNYFFKYYFLIYDICL